MARAVHSIYAPVAAAAPHRGFDPRGRTHSPLDQRLRERGTQDALIFLVRFRKELIPDVARRWRQTNATRLAPSCLIDFLFVADCQATGRFRCDEDRVTHFSARTTVLGCNFLPKPKATKFEFGEFFADLSAQAIFIAFLHELASSGKHPKSIALPSYEKHPSTLRSHQFRGLRHSYSAVCLIAYSLSREPRPETLQIRNVVFQEVKKGRFDTITGILALLKHAGGRSACLLIGEDRKRGAVG